MQRREARKTSREAKLLSSLVAARRAQQQPVRELPPSTGPIVECYGNATAALFYVKGTGGVYDGNSWVRQGDVDQVFNPLGYTQEPCPKEVSSLNPFFTGARKCSEFNFLGSFIEQPEYISVSNLAPVDPKIQANISAALSVPFSEQKCVAGTVLGALILGFVMIGIAAYGIHQYRKEKSKHQERRAQAGYLPLNEEENPTGVPLMPVVANAQNAALAVAHGQHNTLVPSARGEAPGAAL
ncbi:MAG: hypothetical protein EBX40_02730 [Gammaproteobacteria bacterium]|nr:hypothetical protein [Gammaproteobacteria bacterium]